MWQKTAEGKAVIAELTKEVVSQVAPEELEMFDELIQDYFDHPAPPTVTGPATDDPLGFGLGEVIVAATPAAAAMASAAITFVLTVVIKLAEDESIELIKPRLKQLLQPAQKEKTASFTLTREELVRLKLTMHETVRRFGVEEAQANQMSDVFVSSLLLPPIGKSFQLEGKR